MHNFIAIFLFLFSTTIFAINDIPDVIAEAPIKSKHQLTTGIGTTLDQDDFATQQINSILEPIAVANGVEVIQPNGVMSRTTISLRGFSDNAAENTLILLDDQAETNPDLGVFGLNALSGTEVEKIEVTPNSAGVLFGDQAVGGVVHIISAAPEKNLHSAKISYGSFATKNTQATISDIFSNEIGYRLHANYYASNNYRQNNNETTTAVNAVVTYHDRDNYLRYRKINQHLHFPGKLTWEQVQVDPRQAENNIAFNNEDIDLVQFGMHYNLAKNWVAKLTGNLQSMHGKGAYYFYNMPWNFTEMRQVSSLQPKISGAINVKHFTLLPLFGFEFTQGKYELNAVTAASKNFAYFTQVTLPLSHHVTTIVGARYATANYDLVNHSLMPTNSAFITSYELQWQLQKIWQLFLRRAGSYRLPKVDEQSYALNNQPLQTQIGDSYETGVFYNHQQFSFGITLYQLDLQHEIISIPIPTEHYGVANTNIDPTRRRGLMLNAAYQIFDPVKINAAYNFVNAKFSSGPYSGNTMPYVATHSGNVGITYQITPQLHVFGEAIYLGSRYPINDALNRAGKVGGVTLYNLAVGYDRNTFALGMRINNLTNKLYFGYVVTKYQGEQNQTAYYPASGLVMMGNINIKI